MVCSQSDIGLAGNGCINRGMFCFPLILRELIFLFFYNTITDRLSEKPLMTAVLKKILEWIKSDHSTEREAGLLALEKWVEKNKDMTTLNLESNGLGEYAVKACEHLSKLPNLTSVDLSLNDLGEHGVNVSKHLSKLPNLTSLNLNDNGLGEHAVNACEHLSKLPNLTSLNLDLNGLGEHAVDAW